MDERDFKLLEVLNKTKNITHAANLLYVTQSALSKRISAIEEELGTKVILRSRQGIHFTPEGEQILKYTKEAAQQLQQMRTVIDLGKDYISGTLKVGISIEYAIHNLPDILAKYQKQYPHVNTQITTDQSRKLYQSIQKGNIDVAVVRGEYNWKEHKILLNREKVCLIRSQEDKDKPLSAIPYIDRKTDASFEKEMSQWIRENGIHPEPNRIKVNNVTTCVEMVNRGLGWAIIPEICLPHFKGEIEPLHFKNGEPFVRSTYILFSETVLKLPQVKAFITTICHPF